MSLKWPYNIAHLQLKIIWRCQWSWFFRYSMCCVSHMLYISTSVWLLRTPNAGQNSHFQHFYCFFCSVVPKRWSKYTTPIIHECSLNVQCTGCTLSLKGPTLMRSSSGVDCNFWKRSFSHYSTSVDIASVVCGF